MEQTFISSVLVICIIKMIFSFQSQDRLKQYKSITFSNEQHKPEGSIIRHWILYPAWFEGRLVISYGYLSQSSIREVNIAEYFPRWGIGSGSEGSGTELINICVRARSVKGGSPQLVPIPSMFKNYQFLGTQWK